MADGEESYDLYTIDHSTFQNVSVFSATVSVKFVWGKVACCLYSLLRG